MSWLEGIVLASLAMNLAQLLLIFLLARFIGQFLNNIRSIRGIQLGGFEVGDEVPLFREYDIHQNKVSLRDLLQSKKVLLLFISSQCPTCKEIVPHLNKVVQTFDVHLVLINTDNTHDDRAITSQLTDNVFYIRSPYISESYFVNKVPYAMIVSQEGKLESQILVKDFKGLWNMLISEESVYKRSS